MKAIVVIPVYKQQPDSTEVCVLNQCLTILGNHPICLIGPDDLDTSVYEDLFKKSQITFRFRPFKPDYFKNVNGYNRLLLSKYFYERFSDYEYMLIYQLDAWVFRDELTEWCLKGYDYVGAPWMNLKNQLDRENSGNGGFSLRRISSFIKLFDHSGKLLTFKGLMCYHRYRGPLHKIPLVIKGLWGIGNTLGFFTRTHIANEDLFYVTLKYKRGEKFNIPKSDQAMFFSFEERPSLLYELTGHKLPFGCHAWKKWEYDTFWKKYIK